LGKEGVKPDERAHVALEKDQGIQLFQGSLGGWSVRPSFATFSASWAAL